MFSRYQSKKFCYTLEDAIIAAVKSTWCQEYTKAMARRNTEIFLTYFNYYDNQKHTCE